MDCVILHEEDCELYQEHKKKKRVQVATTSEYKLHVGLQ